MILSFFQLFYLEGEFILKVILLQCYYGIILLEVRSLPYTRGDASNFFSHIAFEIGEHHNNQPVKQLIEALYRFVGLSPDPPDEFEDFRIDTKDDAFAVIEINITLAAESVLLKLLQEIDENKKLNNH
jgi:hypothetical protein